MKAARILAIAAIMMVPVAGSLHAQGKSQQHKADGSATYRRDSRDDDGEKGRKDKDRYNDAKPGRRVGPSPNGPGRRVGPNGTTGYRTWGGRVIDRRSQLGLSGDQVARISEIDHRYQQQYGSQDWSRTDAAARDRMRQARRNERREIDGVLTSSQRKQLEDMDRNRYDNR